jgi:hypothetical protein
VSLLVSGAGSGRVTSDELEVLRGEFAVYTLCSRSVLDVHIMVSACSKSCFSVPFVEESMRLTAGLYWLMSSFAVGLFDFCFDAFVPRCEGARTR